MEGHWKFIGGGRVSKAKFVEAVYENKLEFPGGRECKTKNLLWGEYGYFLELHSFTPDVLNLPIIITQTNIFVSLGGSRKRDCTVYIVVQFYPGSIIIFLCVTLITIC